MKAHGRQDGRHLGHQGLVEIDFLGLFVVRNHIKNGIILSSNML
jgi:hypothetical protein